MQKILYWTFLIATIVACLSATEVATMVTIATYNSGDHSIVWTVLTATITWCWLLILILLILRKEFAIIPLILGTTASFKFFYVVLTANAVILGFTGVCNNIATIAGFIMFVSGYLYYCIVYFQRWQLWQKK